MHFFPRVSSRVSCAVDMPEKETIKKHKVMIRQEMRNNILNCFIKRPPSIYMIGYRSVPG